MAELGDYKVLSFDVYGTLIDRETGIINALEPITSALPANEDYTKQQLLEVFHEFEAAEQKKHPSMPYNELLGEVYQKMAGKLIKTTTSQEEATKFGQSIGTWPAFPDTYNALIRLQKHYKLVVLSNVDRESFSKTNAGSLRGFPFDAIFTAQDIQSYKPSSRNFEYMLKEVEERFAFDKGTAKEVVLTTAQSQFHDHHPSQKLGIRSVWIVRPGGIMGNTTDEVYNWKFDTLEEMANAVDKGAAVATSS